MAILVRMCNQSGLRFGTRCLTSELVEGSDVLEVGACDVNGSLRPYVAALRPMSYVGVDLAPGRGVDVVMHAEDLTKRFGLDAFDLVIATEMVEHVRDWRTIVRNMKAVLRSGGHLLVTTRSRGFPYHGWPSDYWRYELAICARSSGTWRSLPLSPIARHQECSCSPSEGRTGSMARQTWRCTRSSRTADRSA